MDNIFDIGKDYKTLALGKLEKEAKEFKGDKYGNAVHTYVANALRDFCNQSESFSKVFYKTKRSFSDCVKEIMKGCGRSISDIEVYRRATKFYFPNSEVSFVMNITAEEEPDDKYINKELPKTKEFVKAEKATKKKKSAEKKTAEKENLERIQLTLFQGE
uniref:PcfK-like protein n=1 Tax=Siphoviridae sp. ct0uL16 TaxID=2825299 RepID=A0A8S5Q6Y6_9CAUD|nr:MAG TPA: PcfK-like protein [Siphoviridae sp. ct0uL16]